MKVFLFLYPAARYINALTPRTIKNGAWVPVIDYHLRLNQLIDIRYRQEGYLICWLLFCRRGIPEEPDVTQISHLIDIRDGDWLLSAGVSYGMGESFRYADPGYVLPQLPRPIDDLKFGGFHYDDCVDRMARAAFEAKLPVLVDEDTTELLYNRSRNGETVPDQRAYTFEGYGYADFYADEPGVVSRLYQIRVQKPWLPQPSTSSL